MGWERSFEKRALQIRDHELRLQKRNYLLEVRSLSPYLDSILLNATLKTIFSAIWGGAPVFVSLVAFWHYAVVRQIDLTPSVAFTSLLGMLTVYSMFLFSNHLSSVYRNEIRSQRVTGNLYQHAPG